MSALSYVCVLSAVRVSCLHCFMCFIRCLCLMSELSRLPLAANDVAKLLPCLATAASHRHYAHHVFFLQSVCKQVRIDGFVLS